MNRKSVTPTKERIVRKYGSVWFIEAIGLPGAYTARNGHGGLLALEQASRSGALPFPPW
jgi:hypothetical protein